MRRTLVTLASLFALAVTLVLPVPLAAAGEAAATGKPAPAFTLADSQGKPVSLASFKGKVVVLEWFNPDCPFVVRHYKAKTMLDLAARYRDRGVVWLAINSSHFATAETNSQFAKDYAVPYPALDDHAGTVGQAYGARTTPHLFVIDKAGNLAYQGAIDDDPAGEKSGEKTNFVALALEALLAGKPVPTPETKPYGCSVKYKK